MARVSIIARRKLVKLGFKDPGSGGSTTFTKKQRTTAQRRRSSRSSSSSRSTATTARVPQPGDPNFIGPVQQQTLSASETRQQIGLAGTRSGGSTGSSIGGSIVGAIKAGVQKWKDFTSSNKAWLEANHPKIASALQAGKDLQEIPGAAGIMGMVGGPSLTSAAARLGRAGVAGGVKGTLTNEFWKLKVGAKVGLKATPASIGKNPWNTKTVAVTQNLLVKMLGASGEYIKNHKMGALILAGASSALLGLWGQAEAPESVMIPVGKLAAIATTPEEFELIDESMAIAEEIVELPIWQAPLFGVVNKIKGMVAGVEVMKAYVEGQKRKAAEGQSTQEFWTSYQEDKVADELMLIETYNQAKIETQQEIIRLNTEYQALRDREQRKANRTARAEWEAYAARQRKLEAEDRVAQMEFWLAYRKMIIKMQDENRPSKLNFGIV